jgi:hypothetical protein
MGSVSVRLFTDKRRLDVEVLEQVAPDPQYKGVC